MGRPTDNPRNKQIGIRISDKELDMLNHCAERLGITRANVITKGIENVYRQLET